jgi:hypothetical protein
MTLITFTSVSRLSPLVLLTIHPFLCFTLLCVFLDGVLSVSSSLFSIGDEHLWSRSIGWLGFLSVLFHMVPGSCISVISYCLAYSLEKYTYGIFIWLES